MPAPINPKLFQRALPGEPLEAFLMRLGEAYENLRPHMPGADDGTLLLIVENMLKPLDGRRFFLRQDRHGRLVF